MNPINYLKKLFIKEIIIEKKLDDKVEIICRYGGWTNLYRVRRVIKALSKDGEEVLILLYSSGISSTSPPDEFENIGFKYVFQRRIEELKKVNIPEVIEVDRFFKMKIGPRYYLEIADGIPENEEVIYSL